MTSQVYNMVLHNTLGEQKIFECGFVLTLVYIYVMRTSMDLSDELYRRVKKTAADEATSIKAVVEKALRLYLGKRDNRQPYVLRWRTESGKLLPGIDLNDRDSLFDAMQDQS